MQVDDGIFLVPLPENDKDQRGGGNYRQPNDEMRIKPVVTLAFIEDHLQSSEAERNKAKPGVVDMGFFQLSPLKVGRILNKPRRKQERNNSDRNVDGENPAPGKVIGDPAAKGGTDGRSHHHRDAVNCECHATLGGSKGIRQDCLLARLQASATNPLKYPEEDEQGKVGRKSA